MRTRLLLAIGGLLAFAPLRAQAQEVEFWDEAFGQEEAGALPDSAHNLAALNLRAVYGILTPPWDVDMYRVNIIDPEQFGVTTVMQPGTHPDPRIYVFDENGFGVYFNDDSPDSTDHGQSTLPVGSPFAPTEPGIYYVAISIYEVIAVDEDGAQIFEEPRDYGPNWYRVNGPASSKPLAGWVLLGDGGEPDGTYTLTFGGLGGPPLNIGVDRQDVPPQYTLAAPYPNPFSSTSIVELSVPSQQHVEAALYDVIGRRVRMLHEGFVGAGQVLRIPVEAGDLPSGNYFVRVQGADFVSARMITLAR